MSTIAQRVNRDDKCGCSIPAGLDFGYRGFKKVFVFEQHSIAAQVDTQHHANRCRLMFGSFLGARFVALGVRADSDVRLV